MKFNEFGKLEQEYNVSKKGSWLKLEVGDNKIRIVSEYEPLPEHYINKKYVVCIGKKNGCSICEKFPENKVSLKTLLWVIDRKDSSVKLAKLPATAFRQICDVCESPEFQPYIENGLPSFDFNIKRVGEGKDTTYNAIHLPHSPLKESEILAIQANIKPVGEIIEKIKAKESNIQNEMDMNSSNSTNPTDDSSFPEEEIPPELLREN